MTAVGPFNGTAAIVTVTDNKSLLIILPVTLITIAILLVLLAVLVCMLTAAYKKNRIQRTDTSGYSHLDRSQMSVNFEELSSEGHIAITMEG